MNENNKELGVNKREPLFNSALAYLERIDLLIRECHKTYYHDNLEKFKKAVVCLYLELKPRMNTESISAWNNEGDPIKNFEMLLKFAHDNGLIIPDKKTGIDAVMSD